MSTANSNIANKYTVLVVDDQPNNLKLVGTILKYKYNVFLANNGSKALDLLSKQKPDLILLDVMMPDMDGYEVAVHIKKQEELADIPILFLTALTDTKAIEKAYQSGGVDYITKPIITSELLARIEVHLNIYNSKRQLKQLNEALELKSKQKDKLLSIITHDMTNSISGSKQLIEILIHKINEGKLTMENLSRPLEAVYREISGGSELLQELLWWAKSQFQHLNYTAEPVDYASIIEKIIHLKEGRSKAKNIQVFTTYNNVPEKVCASSDMLSVVLRNLLDNAIKFSHNNSSIRIEVNHIDNAIVTCVGDEGMGISPERLDKLFQLDNAISTTGTQGEKGTGLGLSLCKGLIETWGGKIWIESVLGKGSKFYFTIPHTAACL